MLLSHGGSAPYERLRLCVKTGTSESPHRTGSSPIALCSTLLRSSARPVDNVQARACGRGHRCCVLTARLSGNARLQVMRECHDPRRQTMECLMLTNRSCLTRKRRPHPLHALHDLVLGG